MEILKHVIRMLFAGWFTIYFQDFMFSSIVGCLLLSFSRRQRTTQPGHSPWELIFDSLNATINSLQIQVINTRSQARLQLQLVAMADSTLHLQLDELNPLRARYRVQDSLAPGSKKLAM